MPLKIARWATSLLLTSHTGYDATEKIVAYKVQRYLLLTSHTCLPCLPVRACPAGAVSRFARRQVDATGRQGATLRKRRKGLRTWGLLPMVPLEPHIK